MSIVSNEFQHGSPFSCKQCGSFGADKSRGHREDCSEHQTSDPFIGIDLGENSELLVGKELRRKLDELELIERRRNDPDKAAAMVRMIAPLLALSAASARHDPRLDLLTKRLEKPRTFSDCPKCFRGRMSNGKPLSYCQRCGHFERRGS